jgi:AraC-like DNA-binding protein
LTLSAFARAIGMSERSIQAALALHGATFSDLLRQYRLAAAHAALKQGRATIAAIAFSSGFQDLSTFNRAFKAAFGITPGEAARSRGA